MGLDTFLLAALLGFATVEDLKTRTIPNALTAAGALAGLATAPQHAGVALLTLASLGTLALARPDGFGMGDAKLAAAIATFVGPDILTILTLTAGFALAWAAATQQRALPMAPFFLAGTGLTTVAL